MQESESQSRRQSHPSELSKNLRKGDVCWGERPEKEGQIEELVSDQNPDPEAPPRSKKGQKGREQRRCQGRSDCKTSDGEEQVCPSH